MNRKKPEQVDKKEDEKFRIRSKVECLYGFLDKLRQDQIQYTLNISYLQKRAIKERSLPSQAKEIEIELVKNTEGKKEVDAKIRITKTIIAEEKKKLSQEELSEALSHVKLHSLQDMVRNSIDIFVASTIPYEVNYRFWQSMLLEQTQDEVRERIGKEIIPNIKKSIDLSIGGQANAEVYLKALEQQEREEEDQLVN